MLSQRKGFTLIELLAVVSIVSLLIAILMPAMASARAGAKAAACRSNLRQLVLANIGYSNENEGFYVPAAKDLWQGVYGGLHRWHGIRNDKDSPFDPLKGPLAGYLADGKVKECPEKAGFTKDRGWSINFEMGCGGYGYNMTYIGSRLWRSGITTIDAWRKAYAETTNSTEVKRPAATLMFADTAFYQANQYLIEYSFAEPPYFVVDGKPDMGGKVYNGYPSPSIHFRHYSRANIAWADGHIEWREMARHNGKNSPAVGSASMKLGWFETVDNTPFDLE